LFASNFVSIHVVLAENSHDAAKQQITIGTVLYLTNDLAPQSTALREGIELAIEEINQSGGINDTPVKLLLENVDSPKSSNTAVRKLISTNHVQALLVEVYDDVMTSRLEFATARVPALCLWDSNPDIDDAGDYVFAIGPWTPSAGETSAAFASQILKAKTAVIIQNADVWSQGVSKYFASSFEKAGGRVLHTAVIEPTDLEFRATIVKAKGLNPDVIYSPIVYNVAAFYTKLRQLGFTKPVISSDIISKEHISKAPTSFEGIYQSNIEPPNTRWNENLSQRYQKRFAKPNTKT